jgi:hypothetical protein
MNQMIRNWIMAESTQEQPALILHSAVRTAAAEAVRTALAEAVRTALAEAVSTAAAEAVRSAADEKVLYAIQRRPTSTREHPS